MESTNTNEKKTFTKTIWVSKKKDFEKKLHALNRILGKQGKDYMKVEYKNFRAIPVEFEYHVKGDAFRNDEHRTLMVEVCDAVCKGYAEVKREDKTYTYIGSVKVEDGVRQAFCRDEAYAPYFTEKFREGWCDHCKSRRTNRKAYYLFVEEETGKVVQIGSSCAKEFFGIDSTAFLSAYGKTFLVDYSDYVGEGFIKSGNRAYGYEEVVYLLDYATNGFLKWNKASKGYDGDLPDYENPTTEVVYNLLTSEELPKTSMTGKNVGLLSPNECLDYWRAKYEKEGSTFAYNCLNAVKAGYAVRLSLGTFCYAIFAAYNAKVNEIREKETKGKEHVPCAYEVGNRVDIKGTVTGLREFAATIPGTESRYNDYEGESIAKKIVDFTDDNGTFYHFTTSAKSFFEIEVGDRISMRCTIGNTKEYRGVPYTRVSRPVATKLAVA